MARKTVITREMLRWAEMFSPVEEMQVAAYAPGERLQVSFALFAPDSRRVFLSGEFNSWSQTATPMTRRDDGHWVVRVSLPPGKYHHKFVADGEWVADPVARQNVLNEYGTLNSIVEVRLEFPVKRSASCWDAAEIASEQSSSGVTFW